MIVDRQAEAAFYDRHYEQFLRLPEESLRTNLAIFRAQLDDPRSPWYERRRLYSKALQRLLEQPVAGVEALDYACGPGDWGILLATQGAKVTLLDLSPVAVELALRKARASGVVDRVRAVVGEGSDLRCFPPASFDLIFACAAIHHVLKYGDPIPQLARLLRPGGRLVIVETLGDNPLLNLGRWLIARWAGQPEDQGEGEIFRQRHIKQLRRHFEVVDVEPLNLLAMVKRLFRGRFHYRPVRRLLRWLEQTDEWLLRCIPGLRRYCGEVVVVARRRLPAEPAGACLHTT